MRVQHFLRRYAGECGVENPTIASEVVAVRQADSWPGNVRELENVTRRLLFSVRGLSIIADSVRQALAEGNQAKAARWLGLSRFTLREKLKQLGLHRESRHGTSEPAS